MKDNIPNKSDNSTKPAARKAGKDKSFQNSKTSDISRKDDYTNPESDSSDISAQDTTTQPIENKYPVSDNQRSKLSELLVNTLVTTLVALIFSSLVGAILFLFNLLPSSNGITWYKCSRVCDAEKCTFRYYIYNFAPSDTDDVDIEFSFEKNADNFFIIRDSGLQPQMSEGTTSFFGDFNPERSISDSREGINVDSDSDPPGRYLKYHIDKLLVSKVYRLTLNISSDKKEMNNIFESKEFNLVYAISGEPSGNLEQLKIKDYLKIYALPILVLLITLLFLISFILVRLFIRGVKK